MQRTRKKKMLAKAMSLIVVLALVISMISACGKSTSNNSNKTSSTSTSSTKTTSKASSTTKQTGTATSKTNSTESTLTGDSGGPSSDSSNAGGQDQERQASNNDSSESSSQPGSAYAPGEEIKMDLGGKTIVYSAWTDPYQSIVPGQTSALSIFLKRMEEAQQKYNFKLEIKVADAYTQRDQFINNAMAGIPYADVLSTQTRFAYPKFVKGNLILPVDDYYDFNSDPVWMSNSYFVNGCNWNGRYYGITMSTGGTGDGIIFNKDNIDREGFPSPFTLLNNGQWTWDVMLDMAQKFTRDVNGDGVVDTYGILAGNLATALVYSNGGRVIDERKDGSIYFGLSDSRSIKALQFAADLYNVYKVVKNKASGGQGLYDFQNVLFYVVDPNGLTNLASVGFSNMGWLPMAKGPDVSECQNVANIANIIVFSTQTQYPKELVKIFADACATWDQSKPDYISPYDAAYVANQSRTSDPETLDCIAKYTIKVGIDKLRGFDGFESAVNKNIYQPITSGTMPVASAIESYRSAAQALIDEQK